MRIIEKSFSSIEIEDEQGYRSTVFLQGDGKWKCLRCYRFRCDHAKFATSENPTLPQLTPLSAEEIDDILTY